MEKLYDLAIIGSGPSGLFTLKRLLDRSGELAPHLRRVRVHEKGKQLGSGMPYSAETTDPQNLANISSAELPQLIDTFEEWLLSKPKSELAQYSLHHDEISADGIYPRLLLGSYFQEQFRKLCEALAKAGIEVECRCESTVVDIEDNPASHSSTLVLENGNRERATYIVLATGHFWPRDEDAEAGFYASPWPIQKLLPSEDQPLVNFEVGTLGSSLSAFDVVNALASRHGKFTRAEGRLKYTLSPEAAGFKIALHSAHGRLPHLQFELSEAQRTIYRHATREEVLALTESDGTLRLERYFDEICRPTLITAFAKNGRFDITRLLSEPTFRITELIELLSEEHLYEDPFAGLQLELEEAHGYASRKIPCYWKEAFDDLIYTLNYHADRLPADDHCTLQGCIMPFLLNVVAAMPLESAETLLALHRAGVLSLIPGKARVRACDASRRETVVEVESESGSHAFRYRRFIDCTGQSSLSLNDYPFPSLVKAGCVTEAMARFHDEQSFIQRKKELPSDRFVCRDGERYLRLGGIAVDSLSRLIQSDGRPHPRIFETSFPHTMGCRPFAYGLQACDHIANLVVSGLLEESPSAVAV